RVPFDGRLPARQTDHRLTPPAADIEPLAVVRDLQAVRARRLAARYFLPSACGVPFPQLAVVLARHHLRTSGRVLTARREMRGYEATIRESDDGVEADRIGRNGTSGPGEHRRPRARVELEDLDRLAVAMVDDPHRVDRVPSAANVEAVCSELVL